MQLETIKNCPICLSDKLNDFLSCKDYLVSQQNFTIQQCSQCGFKLTNPRPTTNTIGQFYKSDQYISHNDESKGIINVLYRMVRQYTLQGKVSLITKLNKGKGSILDIGCGTGSFLEAAQKGGWTITGTEPDSDARFIAQERLKVEIGEEVQKINNINPFNIITLWHVLEHVSALEETLYHIHKRLSPTGHLLLALPNNASWDATFYKEYWAAYDVPRHLHHFTPETITQLLLRHGFSLVQKRPMYFDSFYISMLSANYRDGKPHLVEGLLNGLRSNLSANKTGQYSSLIYVFTKK